MCSNHSPRNSEGACRESSPEQLFTAEAESMNMVYSATRERVLDRFEAIQLVNRGHRLRLHLKQVAWWTVVYGTTAVKRLCWFGDPANFAVAPVSRNRHDGEVEFPWRGPLSAN